MGSAMAAIASTHVLQPIQHIRSPRLRLDQRGKTGGLGACLASAMVGASKGTFRYVPFILLGRGSEG